MEGHRPTSIAALPDSLLLHIFSLLAFWTRRTTVPLVCQAWNKLCFGGFLGRSTRPQGGGAGLLKLLQPAGCPATALAAKVRGSDQLNPSAGRSSATPPPAAGCTAGPEAAGLWGQVLLDFPTECLPATGIYPEHSDQPFVDLTEVRQQQQRALHLL